MSKTKSKNDKEITVKIESVLVEKVENLCNKIEDKLSIVKDDSLKEMLKMKLIIAKKHIEIIEELLETCIDIVEGKDVLSWNEQYNLKELLKKQFI